MCSKSSRFDAPRVVVERGHGSEQAMVRKGRESVWSSRSSAQSDVIGGFIELFFEVVATVAI